MNIWMFRLLTIASLFFSACGVSQSEGTYELIDAKTFQQKLAETPEGIVLDVRTPSEYAGGHIEKAINVDWNGSAFDSEVSKMDKSKTYFVYCLAGGRSAAAVEHMRSLGFNNIVELEGGMMKWRSLKLPETTTPNVAGSTSASASEGMTVDQFKELLKDERYVLVDFYAEWCGPCKKMKPFLDEISQEMASTVKVVRIDVDKNRDLAAAMQVDALPTLQIVKNNQMIWSKVGFADKNELLEQMK